MTSFICVYFIISLLFTAASVRYVHQSFGSIWEKAGYTVLIVLFGPIYLIIVGIETLFRDSSK